MADRILEAAFQVFSTKGYHATKVTDVTDLAECSVGIFYKRFKDKEGLFFTLQHRHFSTIRKDYELISRADASQPVAEIARVWISNAAQRMSANTGFIKAQVELALTNPKVAEARLENVLLVTDHFLMVLDSRGEVTDREDVSQRLMLVVRMIYAMLTHIVLFGPAPFPLGDKRLEDSLTQILTEFVRENAGIG